MFFVAAPSQAVAGERRPATRKAPLLSDASPRAGLSLWIEGGVGAIVPIPAGGGGGLVLSYPVAKDARVGVFGHCTGASAGPTSAPAGEAATPPRKAGVLCDAGLVAGIHGAPRPIAPDIELGVGWGFMGLVDESRRAGRYSGTGVVLSARVGARIGARYQVMLRGDVPLFRAAAEGGGDGLYGLGLVGEFGFKLF